MVAAGDRFAVVESTSHGLAHDRVAEIAYDVAVLTNVTSEHLEFHGSLEAYRAAKRRLFEWVGPSAGNPDKGWGKHAVLNLDDPIFGRFRAGCPGRRRAAVITYGADPAAEVRAERRARGRRRPARRSDHAALACRRHAPPGGPVQRPQRAGSRGGRGGAGPRPDRMRERASPPSKACPGACSGWRQASRSASWLTSPTPPNRWPRCSTTWRHWQPRAEGADRRLRVGRRSGHAEAAGDGPRGGRALPAHRDHRRGSPERGPLAILDEIAGGAESLGRRRGQDLLLIADRREAITRALGRRDPVTWCC